MGFFLMKQKVLWLKKIDKHDTEQAENKTLLCSCIASVTTLQSKQMHNEYTIKSIIRNAICWRSHIAPLKLPVYSYPGQCGQQSIALTQAPWAVSSGEGFVPASQRVP